MSITNSLPGRKVFIDSKEFLYFSGTSYLGIPHNPAFRNLLLMGMDRYGTNYSSSRISNIQIDLFDEAELFLASQLGTESAVTASSGFLAGKMLVQFLKSKGTFIYAPNAHPALITKDNDFYNGDFNSWVESLNDRLSNCKEEVFILCNSIDPLFLKAISFDWIQHLPTHIKITLIVDDSHGIGLVGEGRGISTVIPTAEIDIIIVASLGKALGIPGGVIAGKKELINQLKKCAIFGGSSPIVPAYLYAFLNAEKVYKEARKKLIENISYFHKLINHLGLFKSLESFPIFYTEKNALYEYLYLRETIISSFPYPTPQDPQITRVVINSLHETEDLDLLADHLKSFNQAALVDK